jgi:hypothetical protein
VWSLVIRQVLNSALLAVLAWFAARRLLPGLRQLLGRARRPERVKRPGAQWFFVLSMFTLIATSVDYVIVGHLRSPRELGLYSLAFTLGFAPQRAGGHLPSHRGRAARLGDRAGTHGRPGDGARALAAPRGVRREVAGDGRAV